MKCLAILLIFIFILPLPSLAISTENFCGSSTFAPCNSDSDCNASGCSAQVCAAKDEEIITSCEYRECYNSSAYGLSCQCINKKCQWGYFDKTPFSSAQPSTAKQILNFLSSFNPFVFMTLGIILILLSKLAKFIGIFLMIISLIVFLLMLFS